MQQLADGVYGILTMGALLNYYVLAKDDALTLIDIGNSAKAVTRLEKELKAHDWSMDNIQHILITHAHPDHIGGLIALQQRSNAPTYAHRLDAPIIRGEQVGVVANPDELNFLQKMMLRMAQNNQPLSPARVDVELQDGDTLDGLFPNLQVVHLPGHSHGQVGFWLSEKRLLIGADVMMRLPWGLRGPIRAVSPNWQDVRDSIQKVADMNVDILALGHGKPIIGNANTEIQAFAPKF